MCWSAFHVHKNLGAISDALIFSSVVDFLGDEWCSVNPPAPSRQEKQQETAEENPKGNSVHLSVMRSTSLNPVYHTACRVRV